MALHVTGSQTVGPFFQIGLAQMYITEIAGPDIPGEHIIVYGHVFDGDGKPIPDAMIEIWQANAEGKYADPVDIQEKSHTPGFQGFGRIPANDSGRFEFTTIKPGSVLGPGASLQAPHLVVLVYMRGLLKHLVTRMYFPDEAVNATDPILGLVPAERQATLIATKAESGENKLVWDIHMQGALETVFFEY